MSLTTSEAISSPAEAGTNAVLPGIHLLALFSSGADTLTGIPGIAIVQSNSVLNYLIGMVIAFGAADYPAFSCP
jgi:hypothetical protein